MTLRFGTFVLYYKLVLYNSFVNMCSHNMDIAELLRSSGQRCGFEYDRRAKQTRGHEKGQNAFFGTADLS